MAILNRLFSYNGPTVSASTKKVSSALLACFAGALVLALSSCAYRLPTITPPSQELIRVDAASPEQYTVQVKTGVVSHYQVPHDGRIAVGVPSYRRPCGVYLFNVVKVGGYANPAKTWRLSVEHNGQTVRTLSLQAARELATDPAGYHVLKVKN